MTTSSYLIPGSLEWLQFRKNKIGASDVPIICEKTPWSSPYELWQEKLGLKEKTCNEAMRKGTENEKAARECFEDSFGILMFPKVVIHPKYEWLMASLDGLSIEGDQAVEIKSGPHSYEMAKEGIIPEYYQLQLQTQMECADLNSIYYWAWLPGKDPISLKLERDHKLFQTIFPVVECFWRHMQDKTPPTQMEERTDEEWIYQAKKYISIKQELKSLEALEEQHRNILIEMTQDKNCRGAGLSVKSSVCKGRIDYSKIPELKTVNLEAYRGEPIRKWIFQEDL